MLPNIRLINDLQAHYFSWIRAWLSPQRMPFTFHLHAIGLPANERGVDHESQGKRGQGPQMCCAS